MAWLRHQNRDGRNIYIRPRGEHNLSLVDDLTRDAVAAMKRAGFSPAAVIETSPGNFQAWLKHPEQLSKELGTAAARKLAERFGGDPGAADWRHFGRLAGFTNRKRAYRNAETGLHPFVKLIEASGTVYTEADRFIGDVRAGVEAEQHAREQQRRVLQSHTTPHSTELRSIDSFRADPKYGGDGTRIDFAYAIYAASHGAGEAQIAAAIRSRDLSHKGGDAGKPIMWNAPFEKRSRAPGASRGADDLGIPPGHRRSNALHYKTYGEDGPGCLRRRSPEASEPIPLEWSGCIGRLRSRHPRQAGTIKLGCESHRPFSGRPQAGFPDMKGFSPRNLKYMRAFAERLAE